MKTSHLLLLAAASLAPLQAQTAAPAAPAVTLPSSKAIQLAGTNTSLACIAAGNDFISIYNIPQNIGKLMMLGVLDFSPEELAMLPIRSISIATDMGALSQQCQRLQAPQYIEQVHQLLGDWAQVANPTYAAALEQLDKKAREGKETKLPEFFAQAELSPIYISAEIQPEMTMALPMVFAQLPAIVQNIGEGARCNMKGMKADVTIPVALSIKGKEAELPPALMQELMKKTLHVELSIEGNLLKIAIGTNPANFKWAANPEQSVLASKTCQYMDSPLNKEGFLTTSLRAESINSMTKESAMPMAKAMSKIFRDLARAVPADANQLNAAANSILMLAHGLVSTCAESQQDISMIIALDKEMKADIKFPMLGQYATSKMSALDTINDKSIALMQSSGMSMDLSSLPKLQALAPELKVVTDAIQLSMRPEAAAQFMPALSALQSILADHAPSADPMVNMVMSTLKSLEPSSLKVLSGMGSSYGLSMELGASPDADESIVAFAELSNKQQFTDGVTEFTQTAHSLAASMGFPLPPCQPTVSQQGSITSYNFNCKDIHLQADLSDHCLSISNDPAANQMMQQAISAGKGPAVKGAVFYIDFKNAAPYIKELCDDEEDFAAYEAATKPFTSALIQIQNDEPTGTKGSIRITMPLR